MNLKPEVISKLENTKPLMASMLRECEFQYLPHQRWPTIDLAVPYVYFYEQLKCKAWWPTLHETLAKIIGTDEFTLNFTLNETKGGIQNANT